MLPETPFIFCDGLVKIYKMAELEVVALQGLDLVVNRAEMIGIVGASGSGKSTLLNILGGLDSPSAGRVRVDNIDLLKMSHAALTRYRRAKVGFVWQQGARNLMPYLTALENVRMPMMISDQGWGEDGRRAEELLEAVGLTERRHHRLMELSGGEQQRVAIAVAIANNPTLLLADEPTGELDTRTAEGIFQLLRSLNERFHLTTLIVSHDITLSRHVDRVVAIRDGKTSSETVRQVNADAAGAKPGDIYEEITLLDSAGRLQVPRDFLEHFEIKGKARLELVKDGILIRPFDKKPGEDSDPPTLPSRLSQIFKRHPAEKNAMSANPGLVLTEAAIIETTGVWRIFHLGKRDVPALRGVNLNLAPNRFIALKGRSGSGKTTLLNCLSGLDQPTAGTVRVLGRDITHLDEDTLTLWRRHEVGVIFQSFGLLPTLSAYENVELMQRLINAPAHLRKAATQRCLELVGIARWSKHRPYEMSGGQQQRVAIARALVNAPRLILADEPTGKLDSTTARDILKLFRQIVDEQHITLVMSSHDPLVDGYVDEVVQMRDGRIIA